MLSHAYHDVLNYFFFIEDSALSPRELKASSVWGRTRVTRKRKEMADDCLPRCPITSYSRFKNLQSLSLRKSPLTAPNNMKYARIIVLLISC